MDGISFVTWLEISGPTFAVLLVGFSLLWTQQQATNSQLLEMGRAVGRLEGSISRLDGSMGRLEGSVGRLESSVGSLDATTERLGEAVKQLSERLGPSRSS